MTSISTESLSGLYTPSSWFDPLLLSALLAFCQCSRRIVVSVQEIAHGRSSSHSSRRPARGDPLATDYLTVQQIRFGERLVVRTTVHQELYDRLIPRPAPPAALENAVKHGVARREEPTHLTIAASQRNGALHLEVVNDAEGQARGWCASDRRWPDLRAIPRRSRRRHRRLRRQ